MQRPRYRKRTTQYRVNRGRTHRWWRAWLWAGITFLFTLALLQAPGDVGGQVESGLRWVLTASPDLQLREVMTSVDGWSAAIPVFGDSDDTVTRGSLLMPVLGETVSGFGWREGVDGEMEFHDGLDFAITGRQEVVAAAAGEVKSVRSSPRFGLVVEIAHGQDISTIYGRLISTVVSEGSYVDAGQVIGKGDEEAGFIHFEVRYRNVSVDPSAWMMEIK